MLALTKIKTDMEFNSRLKSVLDVLKSIAAAQFRTLEQKLYAFENLDTALGDLLNLLKTIPMKHPFLEQNTSPLLAVAVTSDQGLLGGLNVRVVRSAIQQISSEGDQLVVVGDQGKNYARDLGISFAAIPGVRDHVRDAQATELGKYLFERVVKEGFRSVQIIYPRALSLVNQRVVTQTLLPVSREQQETAIDLSKIILESPPSRVLEYAVYVSFGQKLKEIFSQSRLAEAAARYTHLEESSQKLDELNKKLKTKYFRLRHEVIDASMRDLFSARVVYAS